MGAVSFFILTRFILPQWFPLELDIFLEWSQEFLQAQEAAGHADPFAAPPFEELPREVWNMLLVAQNCVVFLFWLYFAVSETFFKGQTLGKKTFRLSVVHMLSLGPPDLPTAFIRSILKTICLFTLFPIALISFFLVFFIKFKRAGHDLVSKTIVIEDNSMVVEKRPPGAEG